MKEARYFYVPDAAQATELPPEEARHAVSVLRLKAGDEIFLMDGEGSFYQANVTLAATKNCMYDIVKALPQQKTWKGHVHLFEQGEGLQPKGFNQTGSMLPLGRRTMRQRKGVEKQENA